MGWFFTISKRILSLASLGKSSLKPSPSTSSSPIFLVPKVVWFKSGKSLKDICLSTTSLPLGVIELIEISEPSVATIRKLAGL